MKSTMNASIKPGKFESFLEQKGLRLTRERCSIYEKVIRLKDHFDADSLYDSLKESRIARGTVYRTLPLLLESGVLQMSVGDGKREYYETKGTKGHHDHMYCIDCHKVIEFHSDDIEAIQTRICGKYKFEMSFHDHRIYGHCVACRTRK